MKVSYKVLKNYIKNIKTPEEISKDLIMHTAEVEEIHYEGENLEKVFIGKVISCEKHPNSDKLNCTKVEINGEILPIVCGAPNVKTGLKVPVALVGAKLTPEFIIQEATIRGEISKGMICSKDELGLVKERQNGIFELPENAPLNMNFGEYLNKNDIILEIDNKAINHRPDLFSHIGIAREIETINGKKLDFEFEKKDFSSFPDLGVKVENPLFCSRYICVKVENVENIESSEYIKEVLGSASVSQKGLLVDISNYSLYLYGQPTHCFDAEKVKGKITIRFAKDKESFLDLNDEKYELCKEDLVIVDEEKVLALAGIIGGKESCVSDSTKSILIESACFDQAILRKTGKRLGIRTDALNVFEKDIVNELQIYGASLIVGELEKVFPNLKITGFSDIYDKKQEIKYIDFDLNFINKLIGKNYLKEEVLEILKNLGIIFDEKINKLIVPFWRKDLNFKADIAEEIAGITGYNNIKSTLPNLNPKAVIQENIYKLKNNIKDYFSHIGYFDLYTYTFVNEELMQKCLSGTENLVSMKNALSEELTHLRGSLIPNLLLSLEKNNKDFENLKIFEVEKIFQLEKNDILETYSFAGLESINEEIAYFKIQNTISNFLKNIGILEFEFESGNDFPKFSHNGRSAFLSIYGEKVGIIGEIHPKVAKNFEINGRIGFFEINLEKLKNLAFQIVKAKDLSNFQENNFDLNFVVSKEINANILEKSIKGTNKEIITKVFLKDIYENDEKLPGKRSLTFTIFMQSSEKTLDDTDKANLIGEIIKNVSKVGGELRDN